MIIVSGLSGSGKSIALETLEDLDYFCVDNLPLSLLKPFTEALLTRERASERAAAVGIDARNFSDQLASFPALLGDLQKLGLTVEVLFLQADDDVLLKRFSETRRRHPLSRQGVPLTDAIRRERELLATITGYATLVIDTGSTNIHELRDLIRARLHDGPTNALSLLVQSFAFKRGVPADADFVFDVRCLPNPHWQPALRDLTGLDTPVAEYLHSEPLVKAMFDDLHDFLSTWLPRFETGSRSYLTVAIGCTGGQHRSVYLAERLAAALTDGQRQITTRHPEIGR